MQVIITRNKVAFASYKIILSGIVKITRNNVALPLYLYTFFDCSGNRPLYVISQIGFSELAFQFGL